MANSSTVTLRPVHPDDATDLYEIVIHPAVVRSMVRLPSMEIGATLEWIENQAPGQHRLVAELAGKVVGSCTLNHHQRARIYHAASLGLMVHPDFWGQGIGTRLLQANLNLADNWLDLKRVELGVRTENMPAIHIYEKSGFAKEGTRRMASFGNGRWEDEYLMARLRGISEPGDAVESPAKAVKSQQMASKQPLPEGDILIRPIHPDDTADLHALWRHPAVDRTTLQMPSMEYSQAVDRVNSRRDGLHRLVAEVNGRVVGSIVMEQLQNPRLVHIGRMGMMVSPEYWGLGIGTRLMEAILDLSDNWLQLRRVELEVNTDNSAAIHMYEKLGFIIEGTKRHHAFGDGRWADSHFMARIRELV